MNIQAKIEEIRSKPEHIRMRYMVASVAVSMLIITVLWIFSITTSFQSQQKETALPLVEKNSQTDQSAPDAHATQSDTAPSLNEWIKK